jgi:hypothetical protein
MEKETKEMKQDTEEIEVLDEGLEDETVIRSICCWGAFLVLR